MTDESERTRRVGGDLWEGATARRASLRFVVLEALLISVVGGLVAADHYGLSTPNAIAAGVIAFVVVLVILQIPVVGPIAGIAMSVLWGVIAFNIAFNLGSGAMLLGIVVGVVVGAVSLSLHLGFSR